ncbi:hypothetical protein ROJ8625_01749 [Roseivivax jejudonensis]|uniref:Uncharacterized protein n=1 Tax=Roseivivax jejudonensis TaxID=1529041 RepID=A0A1X6Z1M1_9RHOB|nr:hypothetical protein [Roseivivax jejudonensis]SLN38241.1 hypothetical protein ROJ8625_01749 [Roseivivax jejudonensis]
MRAHTMRDFTMCKALLLAALIGVGHLTLALDARAGTDESEGFSISSLFGCDAARAV